MAEEIVEVRIMELGSKLNMTLNKLSAILSRHDVLEEQRRDIINDIEHLCGNNINVESKTLTELRAVAEAADNYLTRQKVLGLARIMSDSDVTSDKLPATPQAFKKVVEAKGRLETALTKYQTLVLTQSFSAEKSVDLCDCCINKIHRLVANLSVKDKKD